MIRTGILALAIVVMTQGTVVVTADDERPSLRLHERIEAPAPRTLEAPAARSPNDQRRSAIRLLRHSDGAPKDASLSPPPPASAPTPGPASPIPSRGARASLSDSTTTTTPLVSVETHAPEEIVIGHSATFTIAVRNEGRHSARGVKVHVNLPKIAKLTSASLPIEKTPGGVQFDVGELSPRSQRELQVVITPTAPGRCDLSASVSFSTDAKIAVQVRKPEIHLAAKAPRQAVYAIPASVKLTISNHGDGTADNVTINAQLAEGLHPAEGANQPLKIGALRPGESREVLYQATPMKSGNLEIAFVATAAGELKTQTQAELQVVRPMVDVQAEGPQVLYIGRTGKYSLTLSNPGDISAEEVEVSVGLSPLLDVKAIDHDAVWDRSSKRIVWRIPRLRPEESKLLGFHLSSSGDGLQTADVHVTAKDGLEAKAQHTTRVLGKPDLHLFVTNSDTGIEVGATTNIDILLENRGVKQADKVVLSISLPHGLQAEGSDSYRVEGGRVTFPAVSLKPGSKRSFRLQVLAAKKGEHILRIDGDCSTASRVAAEKGVFVYDTQIAESKAKGPSREDQAVGPNEESSTNIVLRLGGKK